tara:strand:- start:525 stop:650 length:126 start_codon:yes stop_codon:yes gene_type:complete
VILSKYWGLAQIGSEGALGAELETIKSPVTAGLFLIQEILN